MAWAGYGRDDEQGALPDPWIAFESREEPHVGDIYYYNFETRDVTWDRPEVRIATGDIFRHSLGEAAVVRAGLGSPPAELALLETYLLDLNLVPLGLACGLTGLEVRDVSELAAVLLSEAHARRRDRLRVVLARLAELDCGDGSLACGEEYRRLLSWSDRRFQEFALVDGRKFRFDHLVGLGEVESSTDFAGEESLATELLGAPDLFAAVRSSLKCRSCPALRSPWERRVWDGVPFYWNRDTNETVWAEPAPQAGVELDEDLASRVGVDVGEHFASHRQTKMRETPVESYGRYHRIVARPARSVVDVRGHGSACSSWPA